MKKKKCAVFTIVKNENYFLPIWINHYKRFFDKSDIYILDHQTTDGSTKNLDVNVINVFNDLAFDHKWLVDTVQNFQKKLLNDYECVLFAESDEIIYSVNNDLNNIIDDFISSNFKNAQCSGYEILHNIYEERCISPQESIIDNRNYWFFNPLYSKVLLSKIPLFWHWGFHEILDGQSKKLAAPEIFGLTLLHLHRVDFELMLKRHEERATKWNLKVENDLVFGRQHRIGSREEVLKYMLTIPSERKVEKIPVEHKRMLKI